MTFSNPTLLYFLILIPFVFISLIFIQKHTFKKIFMFIHKKNLEYLVENYKKSNFLLKSLFISLSLSFFIISLAQPQLGETYEEIFSTGNHIMIVFDISNSMLAEDLKPSRLSVAKHNVARFIDSVGSDKIGLVIFSGSAVLLSPLTTDHSIIKMYLDLVDTSFLSSQGTAVAKGLQIASEALAYDANKDANKIILLVTDGEDHEGNIPIKFLKDNNIKIYSLAVGYESGAPIPEYSYDNLKTAYLKDKEGEIVISKVNINFLKDLSSSTGGAVFYASFKEDQILELVSLISKQNTPTSIEEKFNVKKTQRYRWSLIPATLFFLLGVLI